jgi:hypothetical protein
MPQETPWYRKNLAELLPYLDTTDWPDTAKRAVAPIDSYLMWNKLRQTPGGEELYRNTPGPVAPLRRGDGNTQDALALLPQY